MVSKDDITITGSCRITENRAFLNGEPYFSSAEKEAFPVFMKALYKKVGPGYPKFYKMDPLTKLGFISAELLLTDNARTGLYPEQSRGIVLMNASASADVDRSFQKTIEDKEDYYPSPGLFVYTLPNIMAGEIAIRHKLKGENTVFILPTFSMEFLIDYVDLLFETQKVTCCLAGWVEVDDKDYDSLLLILEKGGKKKENAYKLPFTRDVLENLYKPD
ncbi:MAG: hypothetical protein R6T99_02355 [Bacteroidales bacterium]